jgi:hypothetical protein
VARARRAWHPVGVDSPLERSPSSIPAVPHRGGHLELLPFDALSWPDFESLQWRILRDVEGLRHAQIYGDPGQAQLGLDIVAVAADGSGVALQSKRVQQFGPARFSAAVKAFRDTTRPFSVLRFILGVSREIRTTSALDRFKLLQKQLGNLAEPVEFELWDQRELSLKLKGAPAIVIEYFGNDIAEIFCDPFTISHIAVPRSDVIAIRQAIARTPEVTTGATEMIAKATANAELDPAAALALVEQAQDALTDAGFAGHAAQHEALRAALLLKAGRGSDATRRRLDQLWLAIEQGHTTLAGMAGQDIHALAAQADSKDTREHHAVAERALQLYNNPLASLPGLTELPALDIFDRARLAVLAGETALADGNHAWLTTHATPLNTLATRLPAAIDHDTLRTRLRILAAEGSGRWAPVLRDARALELGYSLAALVQARYARHLALRQKFDEADASWDEAAGNACLAEHWSDAARWTLSRRTFRTRWQPFNTNQLLPIQTALAAQGTGPSVLTRDDDAVDYASGLLADNRLRAAAIAAQRALRDAVTLSDWAGERRARRLLADILSASGEHLAAANQLILAGEVKRVKQLGNELADLFLDVTPHLAATPWWIAGTAYRLIAAQADLIPDDAVSVAAGHAIAELTAAQKRTLVDLSGFEGSRYLGAIGMLAGIARRLNDEQAAQVLAYFEAQPAVEPDHYRYHDDDEAKAVAGILTTHPKLTERGLAHLIELLGRSQTSRRPATLDAVTAHMNQAEPLLEKLAEAGNRWAREVLDTEHPEQVSAAQIHDARARLEQPLVHTPGVMTVGSSSASLTDAVLVRTLAVREQQAALRQLIGRGADPHVAAADRAGYLIAASNLAPPATSKQRADLLDRVLSLVLSPPESVADALEAAFRHPLGALRMTGHRDTRGEAAYLAASLATTRQDRARVRTAVLGLVGDTAAAEVWVTRALQRLGDSMAPDIGFLSGQNWALKSFSAILWAKTTRPEPVGYRLAADPDVRVRRALAAHLMRCQADEDAGTLDVGPTGAQEIAQRREVRTAVLARLREDPCFSVRTAATTEPAAPAETNSPHRAGGRGTPRRV